MIWTKTDEATASSASIVATAMVRLNSIRPTWATWAIWTAVKKYGRSRAYMLMHFSNVGYARTSEKTLQTSHAQNNSLIWNANVRYFLTYKSLQTVITVSCAHFCPESCI